MKCRDPMAAVHLVWQRNSKKAQGRSARERDHGGSGRERGQVLWTLNTEGEGKLLEGVSTRVRHRTEVCKGSL